jgi:hypothetical protein
VSARFEPGLVAPGAGFDPKQHIAATFDGQPVADIFASAAAGARDIPARANIPSRFASPRRIPPMTTDSA